jgi:4-amino-4-deoxy-L-arabinose transferase-like glycosyltransferase
MTVTRRFWIALGGLTFVGLVIRFVNVLVWRPTDPNCEGLDGCFRIAGDAAYGHFQGELLAQGHGFASSAAWVSFGEIRPGAGDPPLYAMFLGLVSALNGSGGTGARAVGLLVLVALVVAVAGGVRIFAGPRAGWIALAVAGATAALLLFVSVVPGSPGTAHRLASGVAGAAGVAVVGIVARAVAGRRAGLIAAALAAIYPMLWINDGMLLSESLYVPLVMLAVLAGYHFWRDPSLLNAVWVGLALALATLTRAEALLLYAFMLLPLAWGLRRIDLGRRVGWVVVSGAVGFALLVPWLGYNLARFDEPVFMTAGTGAVLSAGSCDTAYRGEFAGYSGANCFQEYVDAGLAEWPDTGLDESAHDVPAREAAVEYIGDHLGELPKVMALRVGRMWDLYKPGQNTELNYRVEGRGIWASKAGLAMYFALLVPAAAGTWLLWRRRLPISPLVSVLAMVTVTAALTFGVTRYRAPADAVLVVLAAVALDALIGRWRPVVDDPVAMPTKDEWATGAAEPWSDPDDDEPVGVPARV